MFKKITYVVLLMVSFMAVSPHMTFATEEAVEVATLSDQEATALLASVTMGDAPIQVAVLTQEEIGGTEGASKLSRWYKRQRSEVKSAIITVVVAAACILLPGGGCIITAF